MRAALPKNEESRLNALKRFEILDTEQDEIYDSITQIAANIMGTPMAVISLIDSERQWFKSKIGIDATENPREHAFCAHAILDPFNPLIVNNATLDKRFSDNPYVTGEPKIRFYFGTPLVTTNNEAIGTICTFDSVVRKSPTPTQIDSLKQLSKIIMFQFEMRQFMIEIHTNIKNLDDFTMMTGTAYDMYKDLNDKCDTILDKIKARRLANKKI